MEEKGAYEARDVPDFTKSFEDLEETVKKMVETEDKAQVMNKVIQILNDGNYEQDIHWNPVNVGLGDIDKINNVSKDQIRFFSTQASHTISQSLRIFLYNNLIILILSLLAALYLGTKVIIYWLYFHSTTNGKVQDVKNQQLAPFTSP